MRLLGLMLLAVVLLSSVGVAYADSEDTAVVPEASAAILAPMGIAAVIAAERRRRRLAGIRQGVGAAYFLVKRATDVTLSGVLLLAFSPIVAMIALLVRIGSPGPVFFRRKAIGRDGKSFHMLKFRSMVEGAEQILEQDEELRRLYYVKCKLEADPRVTSVGRFLRRTSLDELPQLINVFQGSMTFVGPRPIADDEIDKYGPAIERFKTVTPGITGIWQTCGRSETSYERRVEMDMLYIDRRSILLDLWIILCTIPAVLLKRGAQ